MTINHPNFGTQAENRVIIFDTTLRDGMQGEGMSLSVHL